jgi:hypothetical protein
LRSNLEQITAEISILRVASRENDDKLTSMRQGVNEQVQNLESTVLKISNDIKLNTERITEVSQNVATEINLVRQTLNTVAQQLT